MMATADLITSFLSNEMNPEREREFLLSVAASDSLRLELKSHMLLDRILLGQAQRARVPDGIRATILAAAGVGTAAATSTAKAEPKPAPARRGSRFARFGGRIAMFVAAGAFFGLGYYAGGELSPSSAAPQTAGDDRNSPVVRTPSTDAAAASSEEGSPRAEVAPAPETPSAQFETPTSARPSPPAMNDPRRSSPTSDIASPTSSSVTDLKSPAAVGSGNDLPEEIVGKQKRVKVRTKTQTRGTESTPLDQSK